MKLKGPENCGGFSHGGESFAPDEAGCIEVPDDNTDAIVAALSHGYAQAPEQPAAPQGEGQGEGQGEDEQPVKPTAGKKKAGG
jgi:hypothetical protein